MFTGTAKIYNNNNGSNSLCSYCVLCQVLHIGSLISVFPTTLQGGRNYHYSHFTDEEIEGQNGPTAQHRAHMWESQNLNQVSLTPETTHCAHHTLPLLDQIQASPTGYALGDQQALNPGLSP